MEGFGKARRGRHGRQGMEGFGKAGLTCDTFRDLDHDRGCGFRDQELRNGSRSDEERC